MTLLKYLVDGDESFECLNLISEDGLAAKCVGNRLASRTAFETIVYHNQKGREEGEEGATYTFIPDQKACEDRWSQV